MPQTIDNLSVTWANSLTTFTAFKFNAIDTASAAGSLLIDLQVGGSSQFNVSKAGRAYSAQFYIHPTQNTGLGGNFTEPRILAQNNTLVTFSIGGMKFVAPIGFTSGDPSVTAADAFLGRRAAANLRLGAADAAGSAIAISSVASNQLTLASAHGLTTGAAVIITGTAAPSGTSLNTRYYARVIAAAVIELYSTYDQATAASGTTGIIAVTTAGTSASVRLATPFQSFGVQDFTGTDIPGQPFIIRGSRGTGTGAGGDIIFQVAPAGTAGSSQNALATALTIGGDRNVTIDNASAVLQINRSGTSKIVSYVDGGSLNSVNLASDVGLSWNSTTTATGSFDLAIFRDASNTLALRRGTNPQTFRVYNTTDGTNSEFLESVWSGNVAYIQTNKAGSGTTQRKLYLAAIGIRLDPTPASGGSVEIMAANISTDTTTGMKIGTATTQKLGFYNKTPVVQPTAVADATDAATAITQLNALLSRMRDLGLIAT